MFLISPAMATLLAAPITTSVQRLKKETAENPISQGPVSTSLSPPIPLSLCLLDWGWSLAASIMRIDCSVAQGNPMVFITFAYQVYNQACNIFIIVE